jgi:hypothetical protein
MLFPYNLGRKVPQGCRKTPGLSARRLSGTCFSPPSKPARSPYPLPLAEATKLYKALKSQGKTVEMEIYPRGGHAIYEPALEEEIMRRNLEWFRKWLRP